jgi:hypothetical protein
VLSDEILCRLSLPRSLLDLIHQTESLPFQAFVRPSLP